MPKPICKECKKPIIGNVRIMVNQKTLEDYRLCSTCYYFKFENEDTGPVIKRRSHDEVVLDKRDKKMKQIQKRAVHSRLKEEQVERRKERAMNAVDLLKGDFKKMPIEELRKIRHQLYARRHNSKDVKIQAQYTKRIVLLKSTILAKKK